LPARISLEGWALMGAPPLVCSRDECRVFPYGADPGVVIRARPRCRLPPLLLGTEKPLKAVLRLSADLPWRFRPSPSTCSRLDHGGVRSAPAFQRLLLAVCPVTCVPC